MKRYTPHKFEEASIKYMIAFTVELTYGNDVDFEQTKYVGPYTSSDIFKNKKLLNKFTQLVNLYKKHEDIPFLTDNFDENIISKLLNLFEEEEVYIYGDFDIIKYTDFVKIKNKKK